MNDWLQKFSTAEKNRKGFKRRERSQIWKDCQHTWEDLSLTTSRERLIIPCMAAIRTYSEFKFCIQRPGIRFKPGYKQAGISQIFIPKNGLENRLQT